MINMHPEAYERSHDAGVGSAAGRRQPPLCESMRFLDSWSMDVCVAWKHRDFTS
jgi:hypothetical protein